MAENPDFQEMKRIGKKIYSESKMIKKKWNELLNLPVKQKQKYVIMYANYNMNILGNKKKFTELVSLAKKLMIKKDNNSNDIQNYSANDSYETVSRGVIVISGELSQLGIIQDVNQQICSIFGYKKSELIG